MPLFSRLSLLALTTSISLILSPTASAVGVTVYTPDPQICQFLGHPQYKCPDPIWCFHDWPQGTGNYGGEPVQEAEVGILPAMYHLKGGYGNWLSEVSSDEFLDGPGVMNGTDSFAAVKWASTTGLARRSRRHRRRSQEDDNDIVDAVSDPVPNDDSDTVVEPIDPLSDTVLHANSNEETWDSAKNPNTCCRPTMECFKHIRDAPRGVTVKGDEAILDFTDWQKAVCCVFEWAQPKELCPEPDDSLPIKW